MTLILGAYIQNHIVFVGDKRLTHIKHPEDCPSRYQDNQIKVYNFNNFALVGFAGISLSEQNLQDWYKDYYKKFHYIDNPAYLINSIRDELTSDLEKNFRQCGYTPKDPTFFYVGNFEKEKPVFFEITNKIGITTSRPLQFESRTFDWNDPVYGISTRYKNYYFLSITHNKTLVEDPDLPELIRNEEIKLNRTKCNKKEITDHCKNIFAIIYNKIEDTSGISKKTKEVILSPHP